MKIMIQGFNSDTPQLNIGEGDGAPAYPGYETVLNSSANTMYLKFLSYNAVTLNPVTDNLPDASTRNTVGVVLCKFKDGWAIVFCDTYLGTNVIGKTLETVISSKKIFAYSANIQPTDTILDVVELSRTYFATPSSFSKKYCVIYNGAVDASLVLYHNPSTGKWIFEWEVVLDGSSDYIMGVDLAKMTKIRVDALTTYQINSLKDIISALASDIKSRYMVR